MTSKKIISIILSLSIALGILMGAVPVSATETTLTDAEIQELVERSKLDTGDKYDDNIFAFDIQNLEGINATLKAAAEADKTSLSKTASAFDAAVAEIEASGLSVKVSVDGTQITRGENVTLITSTMSERNTDLSLPYSVLSETVGYARVANAENNHTYTGLKPNVVYTAELKVEQTKEGKNLNRTYIANYGIGFNEDGTLYCESTVIDVTDIISEAKAYFAQPLKVDGYNEPLNRISDNAIVYTDIEAGEEKYFVFTATESGFVDTVLYSEEATDAKITVRKLYSAETYEEISARPEYTSAGSRHSDAVFTRFYANEGESYAVTIEGGNIGGAVVLSNVTIASPVWFPQWAATINGTIFWDDLYLASLMITGYIKNDDEYEEKEWCFFDANTENRWTSQGCKIHAFAKLMRDTNRTVNNIYDVRESTTMALSGIKKSQSADPYITFLVNNNKDGTYSNSFSLTFPRPTNPMALHSWSRMQTAFGYSSSALHEFTNTGSSSSDQYDFLLNKLNTYIEIYPDGFILANSSHSIVICKVNGELRVFDSGRNGTSLMAYRYNVPVYTYFVSAAGYSNYSVASWKSIRGFN